MIHAKIRNNICLNAHPEGCKVDTLRQIAYAKGAKKGKEGPKSVLVIGSSMGYGLATRIMAAFGYGAPTAGVMYEKPASEKDEGSVGWHTTAAFEEECAKLGIPSITVNGDAFSKEVKEELIGRAKAAGFAPFDLVVYSLASPVRKDPETGVLYRSVLKPLGQAYVTKTLDIVHGTIKEARIEPASPEEVEATVKVMGGEDWKLWIGALQASGLIAEGCLSLAYSYIGPEMTHAIYRHGTIGKAKEHLERSAGEISAMLAPKGGKALVSVNKALVTRASAVIPGVAPYLAILYRVMMDKGLHEGCIEQIARLFSDRIYSGGPIPLDEEGRIRIDDLEMREDVQAAVHDAWAKIEHKHFVHLGDVELVKKEFLALHGFGIEGVSYAKKH
jgi:enoyl-[acyl-carrier protein] reductase/trans-2-enoyl-CoA reductase (NAD+)